MELKNISSSKKEIEKYLLDFGIVSDMQEASSEAMIILEYVSDIKIKDLILEPTQQFSEEKKEKIKDILHERKKRRPLQHIVGYSYIYGRKFLVDDSTLIPRFDTEILIEEAINEAERRGGVGLNILDMCTGTGCILISLALELEAADSYRPCQAKKSTHEDLQKDARRLKNIYTGIDIEKKAIKLAKRNTSLYGLPEISFIAGDLFEAGVMLKSLDILVSNPPYIKDEDILRLSPEVRDYEPVTALSGGSDGLMFYFKIIENAKSYLKDGASVLMEIGADQAPDVESIFRKNDYCNIETVKDLAGKDRVVKAVYKEV